MNKSLLHPRHWTSWLAIGLLRLIALLPLSLLLATATLIGKISYKLLKHRRHVAEVNIALCFPELDQYEQQQLTEKVIISSIQGMFETAWSWWATDKQLLNIVDYEGIELINEAKANGQGVLLIGSHFTTLDLAGRLMSMATEVDSSYQKQTNPVFDYCILQYRLKRFPNMVEKTEMRRLVKLVKSGRTMWYATDQDFGRKHSVFVPFFSIPTATINTLSSILKLTKAKPLYFSHYRIHSGKQTRYLLRVTDPFAGKLGDDDIENAALINRVIEQAIRVAPEQYMWVHRRFKTRPLRTDKKFYHSTKKR